MLRVQSVDQLLANAEYIAVLVGQEEAAKQALGVVKALAGDKGLEGVDTIKPFIVYGNLSDELTNSEVVLMIPVVDKESFLGLLKNRINLKIDEDKAGLYSTEAPNNMGSIYFRFENGYAYATALNKENIAVAKLSKPDALGGAAESVIALSFRIDRIPAEMKKFALGAIETKLADAKQKPLPNETKNYKVLKDQIVDSVSNSVKSILADGEEVTLNINVDPKKDEMVVETSMTAKKGTELAKDITDLKSKKSVALGGLNSRSVAMLLVVNASLPESCKKVLGPAVDDAIKMGIDMIPADAREILNPLITALVPTLKSGDIDGGLTLVGPTAESKYTVVGAVKVAEGKNIEQAIKDVVAKLPDAFKTFFELNADTAGTVNLHTVKIKDQADEKLKRVVGDSDLWLALRDDVLVYAIGPNAKEMLKSALKATPTTGSVVRMEVSVARLVALADTQDAAAAKKAASQIFGNDTTGDTVSLTVDGGDGLRSKFVVKGKVIRFAAAMDKAKKAK